MPIKRRTGDQGTMRRIGGAGGGVNEVRVLRGESIQGTGTDGEDLGGTIQAMKMEESLVMEGRVKSEVGLRPMIGHLGGTEIDGQETRMMRLNDANIESEATIEVDLVGDIESISIEMDVDRLAKTLTMTSRTPANPKVTSAVLHDTLGPENTVAIIATLVKNRRTISQTTTALAKLPSKLYPIPTLPPRPSAPLNQPKAQNTYTPKVAAK
jgi:hypothetical protein